MISTRVYVTVAADGHRCTRTPDGRTPQDVGCRHDKPKQAVAHSRELEAREEEPRAEETE